MLSLSVLSRKKLERALMHIPRFDRACQAGFD